MNGNDILADWTVSTVEDGGLVVHIFAPPSLITEIDFKGNRTEAYKLIDILVNHGAYYETS